MEVLRLKVRNPLEANTIIPSLLVTMTDFQMFFLHPYHPLPRSTCTTRTRRSRCLNHTLARHRDSSKTCSSLSLPSPRLSRTRSRWPVPVSSLHHTFKQQADSIRSSFNPRTRAILLDGNGRFYPMDRFELPLVPLGFDQDFWIEGC